MGGFSWKPEIALKFMRITMMIDAENSQ